MKKVWFIILSLGLTLSLIISIVLPVSANTSYTITVQAVVQGAGPPPVSLAVPVTWSKTGGLPPYSGEDNTLFNIFQAGGDVTLTAPLTTNDGTLQFFVFRQWLVGTPPAQPEIVTPLRTVTFAPTSNKVATAIYQLISSLGSIYPLEPDFNPVGTDHTVWANIGIPVAGVKVMFQIYGVNSEASGFAYTDALGTATFNYTGTNDGMDYIAAYIDSNNNGYLDIGEPCTINTTRKYWVENFITGGGNIKDSNKKVIWTFDVNLRVLPAGGVDGKFNIFNHDTEVAYRLNEFTMLSFYGGETGSPPASNNTVRFRGTGAGSDGSIVELIIIIEDSSVGKDKIAVVEIDTSTYPPGKNPWIGDIPIPGITPTPLPPPTLVTINGGNFQIHNMKQPTPTPAPSPGRIVLIKQTNPAGANGFPVYMSYGDLVAYPNGVQMSDDFEVDSGFILAPSIYTIIEAPTTGWSLTSIDIADPTGDSYSSGNKAFINLAAGETVIVTYYNTMDS